MEAGSKGRTQCMSTTSRRTTAGAVTSAHCSARSRSGSTSGFMGVATIGPGDWIAEHYHPYSEEFIYVVRGDDRRAARRRAPAVSRPAPECSSRSRSSTGS